MDRSRPAYHPYTAPQAPCDGDHCHAAGVAAAVVEVAYPALQIPHCRSRTADPALQTPHSSPHTPDTTLSSHTQAPHTPDPTLQLSHRQLRADHNANRVCGGIAE